MNEELIKNLSNQINISEKRIKACLQLLESGCTIPFIARYRKEVTDALNEEEIKLISDEYKRNMNLLERKMSVIKLIDEKGLMTEELKTSIMNATKLTEVEDLYLPYKEKKKTKATEAIKMGLEPLAKKIMSFPTSGSLEELVKPYNMDKEVALTNAGYISYIELDGDVTTNIDSFESIVRLMKENNFGYGAINHPVDRDPICGYVGVIKDICPKCGRRANEGVSVEKLKNLGCTICK